MKKLFNQDFIHSLWACVGGFIGWFLGDTDGLLLFLVAMVTADYITGILRAFMDGELSSKVGRKGITKKVMIFVIVGIANLLDVHVFGGENAVLRTAAISFYASNEGLSILENSVQIGLPVPERLKNALKQLNNDEEEE